MKPSCQKVLDLFMRKEWVSTYELITTTGTSSDRRKRELEERYGYRFEGRPHKRQDGTDSPMMEWRLIGQGRLF